jgi:hypothetical protein
MAASSASKPVRRFGGVRTDPSPSYILGSQTNGYSGPSNRRCRAYGDGNEIGLATERDRPPSYHPSEKVMHRVVDESHAFVRPAEEAAAELAQRVVAARGVPGFARRTARRGDREPAKCARHAQPDDVVAEHDS